MLQPVKPSILRTVPIQAKKECMVPHRGVLKRSLGQILSERLLAVPQHSQCRSTRMLEAWQC